MIADAPSMDDLMRDDETCAAWIKDALLGHWHVSCTNRMGAPLDDPLAVVDSNGRVIGIEGFACLRCLDFPECAPCANTNLPTMMVARRHGGHAYLEKQA